MTLGQGYQIEEAGTGEEAVLLAREYAPELVLLDVMLPDCSGLDVCRELKADPLTRSTSIVMLTARAQQSDLGEAEDAGADGYFTKPFSPVALIRKVEEILGERG